MKQSFTIIILLTISLSAFGQITFDLKGTVVSKSIPATNVSGATIQIGTALTLLESGAYNSHGGSIIPGYLVKVDQQSYAIKTSHLSRIQLDESTNIYEQWDLIRLHSNLPESYAKYGYQYEVRNDLEDEAREMISIFYQQYLFFNDDYIEDYLQRLLNKVQPDTYNDLRPGHLNIKILSSTKPDSYCLPDGTIILTTGLISLLSSEEELIAILSNEVAHYVLDHQISNYNAQITREKRTVFWAGVATALAAAGEIYMNVNNDIYTGGLITASTAVLSTSIAEEVIYRLGIEYSQEQQLQADHASGQILKMLNIDSTALSSVLIKMKAYHLDNENYYELSPEGPYPMLDKRINRIGDPQPGHFHSMKYEQMLSLVHTHNAILHLNSTQSLSAISLINRNIDAGVAMEGDYLIKAMALRQMNDSPAGNLEALRLLQTAESLEILPNINVYKQKAITYLRLEMRNEARDAFTEYLQNLENMVPGEYVNSEISWTMAMIHKVAVME